MKIDCVMRHKCRVCALVYFFLINPWLYLFYPNALILNRSNKVIDIVRAFLITCIKQVFLSERSEVNMLLRVRLHFQMNVCCSVTRSLTESSLQPSAGPVATALPSGTVKFPLNTDLTEHPRAGPEQVRPEEGRPQGSSSSRTPGSCFCALVDQKVQPAVGLHGFVGHHINLNGIWGFWRPDQPWAPCHVPLAVPE